MVIILKIFYESIQLALQELTSNKLRTFLSLLGITIGIFCIIAVQSAVDSLQNSIEEGLGEFGSDVVIVDVMPWGEDPKDKYWEYLKRPAPSINDFEAIKDRCKTASKVAYAVYVNGKTVKYKSSSVQGGFLMGSTEEFPDVQNVEIEKGRLFSPNEYRAGSNKVILGAKIVNELFNQEAAVGKYVKIFGHKFQVIGVLKEEGDNPFNFLNYDEVTWVSFNTAKRFVNIKKKGRNSVGKILYVLGKDGVANDELKDEITGVLRSTRRLKPAEEDNFSLNEISAITNMIDGIFGVVNIAGFIIGIFALIVGMISVANIMFVSVKERTSIIGVKRAIGARKAYILLEFLIESVILCVIGGVIGLLFVFTVMQVISALSPIDMWLSVKNASFGVIASVIVGVIAGVIPAWMASNLDPVVAIRQG